MTGKDDRAAFLDIVSGLQRQNLAIQHEIESLVRYVDAISVKTAAITPIAEVIDENEASAQLEREISGRKELITHLFREAHAYLVVVVAAGYAAFFATMNTVSERLSNEELYLSSLLITISLSIFIFWEIISMSFTSILMLTNRLGEVSEVPRWYRIGWPIALFLSVGTALPAAALSGVAYLRGLESYHSQTTVWPSQSSLEKDHTLRAPNPPSSPPPPSRGAAGGP